MSIAIDSSIPSSPYAFYALSSIPANELLAVYNLAGQKAATLVAGWRQAGSYAINWDGRDDRGNTLATGLYLYRLQANGREITSFCNPLR
jgi:flagellar hook assembly protein FlgD